MRKPHIGQKRIIEFVKAVEAKKKFVADPNLIFRHMVSEMGELDRAIYNFEKEWGFVREEHEASWTPDNVKKLQASIGYELLDIIFLACYMADTFQIELNDLIGERMRQIAKQYRVGFK